MCLKYLSLFILAPCRSIREEPSGPPLQTSMAVVGGVGPVGTFH